MSYILNALRKSEQERQSRQSETLENGILDIPDSTRNKTPIWLIILVVINISFLAYFIFSSSINETEEIGLKKNILPTKFEVDGKNTADDLQPANIRPIEKIKQTSIIEQIRKQQARIKSRLIKQEQPTLAQKKISQRQIEKKQPLSDSKAIKKLQISPPTTHSTRDQDKDKTNDLPFLSELDYDFRRTVPKITINVLVYSKIKSQRLILINMVKYVPGDEIISDMKLKGIRMDSIVVEYKNKTFQIPR